MDNAMLITLAIALLAALSMGAIGYVVLGPTLGKQERNRARVKTVAKKGAKPNRRSLIAEPGENQQQRRRQVQATLKQIEARRRNKRVNLAGRIQQAGLSISVTTFYVISAALGAGAGFLFLISDYGLLPALLSAVSTGLGMPRWYLGYLRRRRQKIFLLGFSTALDVIVRGVKAGLPLHDCLRIIAYEGEEPVRSEFRELIEGQAMGMTLEQALERMYERVPLPEVNFLTIVLAIQQKTGGNLAETLANLSQVLRDRKLMRAKVQALSAEAKAGAMIIGSLPPAVMGMIYMTSPDYMSLLITERTGHIMLMGSGFWMLLGVLVMKKMINMKV
jgi:tight adherence protein B